MTTHIDSLINQLTLSTDLLLQLVRAHLLYPDQTFRLMSAQGVWQEISLTELIARNTQLILSHLDAHTPPVVMSSTHPC